jgi:7-cyano-7-deazaguanine synthase
MKDREKAALVLFSGGQDSTTCLAWALERYQRVETIGFDYGQRHRVELECRPDILAALRSRFPRWDARLGEDHVLGLDVLQQLGATAMTHEVAITMQSSGLPNTFVPGRNIVFFTLAAALAYRRELRTLVGGMCETDFSGYPDCRDDTIKAIQVALGLGMDTRFVLETPLMWIDKAGAWSMAQALGGAPLVEIIVENSHTCYLGDRKRRHEWGYGCGRCPACKLRKEGFDKYRAS